MGLKIRLGFLLALVLILAFVAEEGVEAKKRSKREKRCMVKVSEDGRYSVICTKVKNRKMSKRGQRHAHLKSKTASKKKTVIKETLEARSMRKKWERSFLSCRDELTTWFKKESFPDNQLSVRCLSKELLQGFSVQRLLNRIRYQFTCCELSIFSSK